MKDWLKTFSIVAIVVIPVIIGFVILLYIWVQRAEYKQPNLMSEGTLHAIASDSITIGDDIVLLDNKPLTITDENDKVVDRAVRETYYYLYEQNGKYLLTPWKIH